MNEGQLEKEKERDNVRQKEIYRPYHIHIYNNNNDKDTNEQLNQSNNNNRHWTCGARDHARASTDGRSDKAHEEGRVETYKRIHSGDEGEGHGHDGLVFSIDEQHALIWGEDRWHLEHKGNERRLRDPVPYLIAYYMGLAHGFIVE